MLTRSVALACMLAALLPLFTTAPASAGAGSPPPALVGSWSNGSVSLVTYQNVGTGEFAPASGTGELYTVSADGHYVWAHLQQGSLYNCTSLVFSEVEGTVTAGKAGVVLAPSKNTEIGRFSCQTKSNYVRQHPLIRQTFSWKVDMYQRGTKLCLLQQANCARRVSPLRCIHTRGLPQIDPPRHGLRRALELLCRHPRMLESFRLRRREQRLLYLEGLGI